MCVRLDVRVQVRVYVCVCVRAYEERHPTPSQALRPPTLIYSMSHSYTPRKKRVFGHIWSHLITHLYIVYKKDLHLIYKVYEVTYYEWRADEYFSDNERVM